ncbi:40S ribosomal protein S30 [Aphelenchoides bicaudatus]|nr:40S ribosomal protein S30 [Aphelenchoides bicaudatus]
MKVLINSIDGQTFGLDVNTKTTVGQIKSKINEEIGAETDLYLTYGTKILDTDELSLEELEIADLATLNCSARLLGGKVHGSLARAGKVRAQTPKVEAQEKKKQKRGRAFRRMQYNRRYVNQVTSGPGRKRGPNSNSA